MMVYVLILLPLALAGMAISALMIVHHWQEAKLCGRVADRLERIANDLPHYQDDGIK